MNRSLGALAAATVFWLLTDGAGAQVIGTTTDARNDVRGELNATVRQISTGADVSSDETVSTGPASAAVFRFLDGTNLNVGAESSVVLDRYVFDPNGADDVIVNATKGALRFVSAGIGPRSATVVTHGALLGIRGTDFVTWGDATDSERAVLISEGHVRVCPVPEGQVDISAEIQACNAADQSFASKVSGLSCGLYAEAVADGEQSGSYGDVPVGNFVIYKPDCSYIAAKTLPPCAFGVLSDAIAAGEALPTPTTVFATNICVASFNPMNVIPLIPFVPCVAGACSDDDPVSPN